MLRIFVFKKGMPRVQITSIEDCAKYCTEEIEVSGDSNKLLFTITTSNGSQFVKMSELSSSVFTVKNGKSGNFYFNSMCMETELFRFDFELQFSTETCDIDFDLESEFYELDFHFNISNDKYVLTINNEVAENLEFYKALLDLIGKYSK